MPKTIEPSNVAIVDRVCLNKKSHNDSREIRETIARTLSAIPGIRGKTATFTILDKNPKKASKFTEDFFWTRGGRFVAVGPYIGTLKTEIESQERLAELQAAKGGEGPENDEPAQKKEAGYHAHPHKAENIVNGADFPKVLLHIFAQRSPVGLITKNQLIAAAAEISGLLPEDNDVFVETLSGLGLLVVLTDAPNPECAFTRRAAGILGLDKTHPDLYPVEGAAEGAKPDQENKPEGKFSPKKFTHNMANVKIVLEAVASAEPLDKKGLSKILMERIDVPPRGVGAFVKAFRERGWITETGGLYKTSEAAMAMVLGMAEPGPGGADVETPAPQPEQPESWGAPEHAGTNPPGAQSEQKAPEVDVLSDMNIQPPAFPDEFTGLPEYIVELTGHLSRLDRVLREAEDARAETKKLLDKARSIQTILTEGVKPKTRRTKTTLGQ